MVNYSPPLTSGSEILRALFLIQNSRAMRSSGHLCCEWPAAEMLQIDHFFGNSQIATTVVIWVITQKR